MCSYLCMKSLKKIFGDLNVINLNGASNFKTILFLANYLRKKRPYSFITALDIPNIINLISSTLSIYKGQKVLLQREILFGTMF